MGQFVRGYSFSGCIVPIACRLLSHDVMSRERYRSLSSLSLLICLSVVRGLSVCRCVCVQCPAMVVLLTDDRHWGIRLACCHSQGLYVHLSQLHYTYHIIRPRRSRSAFKTFPVDDLSVCASVCPVHCGKTADRIRIPFGIIGRTCPGMRQVLEFGDRSTGRGTFWGRILGAPL